jgi:hypothetical protein
MFQKQGVICIISKKRGGHKTAMPNTPRKSKEWLFFPYLAGLKNSYPEILRRYSNMAKKLDDEKSPKSLVEIEFKQQADVEKNPSPGFQLVAIGLVAYIFHASKIVTITGLHSVSISFIVIGFVMLIIDMLGKIKIH